MAESHKAFESNHFTDMCSGSEAGSYLRFKDFVYHLTLGSRVIKKKKKEEGMLTDVWITYLQARRQHSRKNEGRFILSSRVY